MKLHEEIALSIVLLAGFIVFIANAFVALHYLMEWLVK